ncbi:hypothetical protein HY642_04070 [Candidatus Woesearchaeota archaeon]|nr:hypothetical protein [Candidatus Woesearchaeota archaeon]
MIEIKLLKVDHSGEEEARKLLPYIQSCDVFGPEVAFQAAETAAHTERLWERILQSGCSLTRLKKEFMPVQAYTSAGSAGEYLRKLREYTFRNKVRLWHPERFAEPQLSGSERLEIRTAAEGNAISHAMEGNLEDYLRAAYDILEMEGCEVDMRDKHIAAQFGSAEQSIRRRYPDLAAKEPLRYSVMLGALHSPEAYATMDIAVVLLTELTPADLLRQRLRKQCSGGAEVGSVAADILIDGLYRVAHYGAYKPPAFDALMQENVTSLWALLHLAASKNFTIGTRCKGVRED